MQKERKELLNQLESKIGSGQEAVIIYGPRRVGKTTLLGQFLKKRQGQGKKIKLINCDKTEDEQIFYPNRRSTLIYDLSHDCDVLALDEAQVIPDMDKIIKNLVDYSEKKIELIITGSSTIGITDLVSESNAGRKKILKVYPPAEFEITSNPLLSPKSLPDRLVFGSYPQIVFQDATKDQRKEILNDIVDAYLFKDIFEFDGIRSSPKVRSLAKTIAHRIGKELNINELANDLKLERIEVEKYLDLMEKSFIIFKMDPYSTNQDNVIKKQKKYFFYDLGIRNALLNDFSDFASRSGDEVGKLWENYVILERKKYKDYFKPLMFQDFFWKSKKNLGEQEIDLVEKLDSGDRNHLYGYEIKFSESKIKVPTQWEKNFPVANFALINKNNYLDFILPPSNDQLKS